MIPGEYLYVDGTIELNAGRPTCTLQVNNTGDRPVQIGSHYHFFEVNRALIFDREAAYGMRLDLPAGTAVRFEPGEIKTVQLVALGGARQAYGGSGLVMGPLDEPAARQRSLDRMRQAGFGDTGRPKGDGTPEFKGSRPLLAGKADEPKKSRKKKSKGSKAE